MIPFIKVLTVQATNLMKDRGIRNAYLLPNYF